MTSLINVLGNHLATGEVPGRHGNAHPNIAPYQAFEARDGYLVVAVGNDAQFARLLDALGLADLEGRYATNAQRLSSRAELAAGWGRRSCSAIPAELVDALTVADVPAGPVNNVGQALAAMGPGLDDHPRRDRAGSEPDPGGRGAP